MGVRANADIPRDAIAGAQLSARKASACAAPSTCSLPKTALRHMRDMILARTESDRKARAWPNCCRCSAQDFEGVFRAMDGFPVTIRLLDPPLHEFLPRREELMVEIAQLEIDRREVAAS